jgi:hypothetical protein
VERLGAAYVFALIALISLPQTFGAFLAGDAVTGITWLSQSFLLTGSLALHFRSSEPIGCKRSPGQTNKTQIVDPYGAPCSRR